MESHYLTVEYINAEDVIDSCSCLYLQKGKKFLYIVICLPTEHLGVQMNLLKRVRAFQFELEFKMLDFQGEVKTGVPGEKPLGAREKSSNKLNSHMAYAENMIK